MMLGFFGGGWHENKLVGEGDRSMLTSVLSPSLSLSSISIKTSDCTVKSWTIIRIGRRMLYGIAQQQKNASVAKATQARETMIRGREEGRKRKVEGEKGRQGLP